MASSRYTIPNPLFLSDPNLGAATDLYQLTMAAGYLNHHLNEISTFELSVRSLPENRSFLIAAGLEQVLHYIQNLSFSREIVDYLKGLDIFKDTDDRFFQYLLDFRFSGDIFAVPEGTVVFAEEPILRVTAPLIEGQIVETYLMATIGFQTLIASKASRVVHGAKGRDVIDFGTRRAHGMQAGIMAARACYIAGCAGTSNVLAGYEMAIPIMGTVAHSWTMAISDELDSYRKFHSTFPENTILLIDTFDTINGARLATKIGSKLKAVRIDSGNLLGLSKAVRKILDESGLSRVKIIASGDLNEYKIEWLIKNGAPIDIFGVGTEMVTSKDCPALGFIYKLVEQERAGKAIPKMKFSDDKMTYPSKKQIFRLTDKYGIFIKDIVGLDDEDKGCVLHDTDCEIDGGNREQGVASGQVSGDANGGINDIVPKSKPGKPGLVTEDQEVKRLLVPIVKDGKICYKLPDINEIQRTARDNLSHLPEVYKIIDSKEVYPVLKSKKLEGQMELFKRTFKESRGDF